MSFAAYSTMHFHPENCDSLCRVQGDNREEEPIKFNSLSDMSGTSSSDPEI